MNLNTSGAKSIFEMDFREPSAQSCRFPKTKNQSSWVQRSLAASSLHDEHNSTITVIIRTKKPGQVCSASKILFLKKKSDINWSSLL